MELPGDKMKRQMLRRKSQKGKNIDWLGSVGLSDMEKLSSFKLFRETGIVLVLMKT